MKTSIAIIADFDPESETHRATNEALKHSIAAYGQNVEFGWIDTADLSVPGRLERLSGWDGIFIGPGSPYKNMDGVLSAIRIAREQGIPLLGTCGGFQQIIIEYARNVLNFVDAEHEESAPHASRLVISRLACSLAGRTMTITLAPDSALAHIYGQTRVSEQYLCNFGVNPQYADFLQSGSLRAVATDPEGVIRAVELPEHTFFVGTLFVPQLGSTPSQPHPVVSAFVRACLEIAAV